MRQLTRVKEKRTNGQEGSPIEFESLLEDVSEQAPDGPLQVDVVLTATRAVRAVQITLAVLAVRHATVIPGSIRRVNSARDSNLGLDVTGR